MKLSVLTNLFANLSLDEALAKFEALGIESVEIGCGGYPGKAHCNPEVLLADEKALAELLANEYGIDKSEAMTDVLEFIEKMRGAGVLD